MPKKFQGENSKSAVARARKEAVRQSERERKEKEAEDVYWADDDKSALKKQQRKDNKEKKRMEQMERKIMNKQTLEQEMDALKSFKPTSTKMTHHEIKTNLESENSTSRKKPATKKTEDILVENVNKLTVDGIEARNVDDAISALSLKDSGSVEKHPERRLKAAYQVYEETNLPQLKAENPNLKLSQLKQMLHKDFMKSPDNPLNKFHASYNS